MMKKTNWKSYVVWILLAEAVGALSGWLSREGTRIYGQLAVKPPLSPPAAVFPIVWPILYALMGFGAARVCQAPPSRERSRGLNLFVSQLIFNFFWSLIFFNLRAYGFAFIWLVILWVLVLWMLLTFLRVDRPAGLAQIPYLIWLTFAAYLNAAVYFLN